MELKISPALQAKIERIAAQQGRDSESLVQEALERLVDYDEWFLREVEKGLAQVQSGQVIDHGEISSRMENLITEKQRRG
jgi:predicted transcriptional regulator